jgi:GxxExxY protein
MALTRVPTHLPADLEQLVNHTIGCCIEVHRALGPGLSELVYAAATGIELESRSIAFEREKALPVRYRGHLLCHHRVDLLVDSRLVLEIKSVERIHPVHLAQTVSYLRLTGTRVGLVINFNEQVLRQGIRRVVV